GSGRPAMPIRRKKPALCEFLLLSYSDFPGLSIESRAAQSAVAARRAAERRFRRESQANNSNLVGKSCCGLGEIAKFSPDFLTYKFDKGETKCILLYNFTVGAFGKIKSWIILARYANRYIKKEALP
ncbi:MAG: hypothetical protein IJ221_03360, partial [Oscillibacter sp.]|nr:hypothetical protein [Oscillibacter sp.]